MNVIVNSLEKNPTRIHVKIRSFKCCPEPRNQHECFVILLDQLPINII